MSSRRRTPCALFLAGTLWIAGIPLEAGAPVPGWNTVPVRGVDQDVIYIPARAAQANPPVILFLPGDGGWRGFAVDIANSMASSGYTVFGLDTKKYLSSVTTEKGTLTTRQMSRDLHVLMRWIAPGGGKLVIVGWSQGAAMAVLAAQGRGGHRQVSGVVTVSLPAEAALGWSRMDTLMSLFRKRPHQPHFGVSEHLGSVAPAGIYMIYPEGDDFTSPDQERALFRSAKEPKEFLSIPGANHSFEEARESFWDALRRGLDWTRKSGPAGSR